MEGWEALSAESIAEHCHVSSIACPHCFLACGKVSEVKQGRHRGLRIMGPAYETIYAFGGLCMVKEIEEILYLNDLCDRLGMDTITAGNLAAFAIEASRKRKIREKLDYGDADAIAAILRKIAYRKGIGKILSEGVRHAAAVWNMEEDAIHVKGLEVPMHDPRAFHSMAVNYATSPRGACHLHGAAFIYDMGLISPGFGVLYKQGRFDKKGKGPNTKAAQDQASMINSLVVCQFCGLGLAPLHIVNLLGAVTGLAYQTKEIPLIAERITNLQRVFNLKCGVTAKDDVLPERLLTPVTEGGHAGKAADLESQLIEYYDVRGWDKEGIPTKAKLAELGLEFAIKDLY